MTEPVDLLAVGAHPDDVEMGCGGVLLRAAAEGRRTGIVDLTDGEASTRGTPEIRAQERDRATELLGVATRQGLGLVDGTVGTERDHRLTLVKAIRDHRPRVVVAPYPEDRHPDHSAAGLLAREACFLAGVGRIGEGEPHRPARLYHYMTHHPFTPSFVVDVSSVWDRKMSAVRAYQSQFGGDGGPATQIGGPGFLELLDARAAVHGAMIGVDRGEPFYHPGPVALASLPGMDPAEPAPGYSMFH
jgi:bacillithiol biosynthesis deacetylase BshB1